MAAMSESSVTAQVVFVRRARSELGLTRRQSQILWQLCERGTDQYQHAERLGISVATLKNHRTNLYARLGIETDAPGKAIRAVRVAWPIYAACREEWRRAA